MFRLYDVCVGVCAEELLAMQDPGYTFVVHAHTCRPREVCSKTLRAKLDEVHIGYGDQLETQHAKP